MLIFTNCLTETPDEGGLKTAVSIIDKIKKNVSDVTVISYERKSRLTDVYLKSNKLLLTSDIFRTFAKTNEDILYIPSYARSGVTALRVMILSLFSRRKVKVLLYQVTEIGFIAKLIYPLCNAEFFVLSEDTKQKTEKIINKVKKINVGVDTERFKPVTQEKAVELKEKYGFDCDRPLILHVGHLNRGRNIEQLMKLSECYSILLVTSTLTKNEQDEKLKKELLSRANIKLIDDYVPCIEEIYQMSDVYFFPVVEEGRCIDVPLSCLEAAACNKPVVTTDFGEMKAFKGKRGFRFIDSFDAGNLNRLVEEALGCDNPDSRSAVLEYDWINAVNSILND